MKVLTLEVYREPWFYKRVSVQRAVPSDDSAHTGIDIDILQNSRIDIDILENPFINIDVDIDIFRMAFSITILMFTF